MHTAIQDRADLRRPSENDPFGRPARPRLSQVLASEPAPLSVSQTGA